MKESFLLSLRGALATKQSDPLREELDCFVAGALRNDGRVIPAAE
jgi:hypothetical protein